MTNLLQFNTQKFLYYANLNIFYKFVMKLVINYIIYISYINHNKYIN